MPRDSSPLRCLIWGTGKAFGTYLWKIKYYEEVGTIAVCGITSNDGIYSEVAGYRFIQKNDIEGAEIDICIIIATTDNIKLEIYAEAISRGISDSKIVPCEVMTLLGFDFMKYRKIKESTPTIFSPNCWGGITYNQLGLEFRSPLMNMWESDEDYLKFLTNPRHYIDCDILFKEMRWETNLKRNYPVFICDDIMLHFNHYIDANDAKNSWERRKDRIDWNNLFVMFFGDDPEMNERFCSLPIDNKKCFASYFSDNPDITTVNYHVDADLSNRSFHEIIIGMAMGRWLYYDVFDLLLYNKITTIATLRK